jgi:hypothetical protein
MSEPAAEGRFQTPTGRKVVFTNDPDAELPAYYVNNTRLTLSNWDVRFEFGQIQDSPDDELRVHQTVRLLMSLQHAKALLGILHENIAAYEKAMGGINFGGGRPTAPRPPASRSRPAARPSTSQP